MRPVLFLAWICWAGLLTAQVRINEVQCTRMPGTSGEGPDGDWVELYNAGSRTVDLGGHLLVAKGRTARVPPGLVIAPGAFRVLWCGKQALADHIPLKLPRMGGSLLLIAPDGATVLDLFSWPLLPPGVSIGRAVDGERAWGFFQEPTPGGPNKRACTTLWPPPQFKQTERGLVISGPDGAETCFTTDGTVPTPRSAHWTVPLALPAGTVVHARNMAAGAPPGPVAVFTAGLPDSAWALAIDQADLYGPAGIADTATGNFARSGRAWQRQAWLQQGGTALPVGLSIAGSGSRSLPKRNYKVAVRDRFGGTDALHLPDGTAWRTMGLRADATPHAFLRNTFMEEVARRGGGRVDVQPGLAVPLYLNGAYQGLYRAMPAKGGEWLRSLNKGAEVQVAADDGDHQLPESYKRTAAALLGDCSRDSLERLIDLRSLVELACFDLWTGRADHEINVRAWRSAGPAGRWRWVMYDMDQWAPPAERTLERMCGARSAEEPFLPQLLGRKDRQQLFLARFTALCATVLSPGQARGLADSLVARHGPAMLADHARWSGRMPMVAPAEAHAALVRHITQRNAQVLRQLAEHTGRAQCRLSVQVEPAGAGIVAVEGLALAGSRTAVEGFAGVPLQLEAKPAAGMEFDGWRGVAAQEAGITLAPQGNMRLVAVFRPQALSRKGGL